MSIYGAIAENTRRNERIERGIVTVPSSAIGYVTIDPRVNASIQFIIKPTQMRYMTHFQLTPDDGGSVLATTAIDYSGFINTSGTTVNSITYAPGTLLTLRTYAAAGTAATTALALRFQIWGNLGGPVQNF